MTKPLLALATLAIGLLAFAVSAAADVYRGDPRYGCGNTSVRACINSRAAHAFAEKIRATQHWQGSVTGGCINSTMYRFHCSGQDSFRHAWQGTLVFKHAPTGWRVYITVQVVK